MTQIDDADQNFPGDQPNDAPERAPEPEVPADEIIANPDAGYRWKHLLVAVAAIAVGGWFMYDGFIKWPHENVRITEIQKETETAKAASKQDDVERLAGELAKLSHHSEADLLIQRAIAFGLPTLGLIWGIWTLKETRGSYRFANDTLIVPGHPPISYSNVRRIDKRRWERKGVAYLHYEYGSPPVPGVMKIDDFAFERDATDAILETIETNVLAPASAPIRRTAPDQSA